MFGILKMTTAPKLDLVSAIVVHCSASPWGNAAEVRLWHTRPVAPSDEERKARPWLYGNGWHDIGYHYIVCNGWPSKESRQRSRLPEWDGRIEVGRPEHDQGAHCPELNRVSLAVCLIGDTSPGSFTTRQVAKAAGLVALLVRRFPDATVLGHCETKSGMQQGKTCPIIPMNEFRKQVEVGLCLAEVEHELAMLLALH